MVQSSNNKPEHVTSVAAGSAAAALPRAPHKRRKSEHDRGLPSDLELSAFAEAYLKAARGKWPQLAKAGILPAPTPPVLAAMVEDFKERHRGKPPRLEDLKAIGSADADKVLKMAAGYFRYSCDNSNPTSITDQMTNCVSRAADEGRFIPWQFVYADYSVTGRDASRLGYQSAKSAIKEEKNAIDTLYIDDFSRASRDAIEWWRLAALLRGLKKRMIGVSDQFDLSNPASDTLISVFALLSKLFVQSLQQKVMRGMLGAVGRGTVVGKLALGFTRRPKCDESGSPILGGDGKPTHEYCIDPVTAPIRRLMFELFVDQQWSVQQIRKHFNTVNMDGWNGWTNKAVRDLLASPTAIGKFVWNKTRRELNLETGDWEVKKNPPEEHKTHEDPALALISVEQWDAAQTRLAEIHALHAGQGRRPSRNHSNPSTLFSGTLFCACCGTELKLIRSTDNFKQMGALNGYLGLHDCQLSSSKSTKIIEKCLLEKLQQALLTDEVVEYLVTRANEFLEEEAAKPAPAVANKQPRVREINAQIDRLVRRSSETNDDDVAAVYESRIKKLQAEAQELQAEIKAAETTVKWRTERIDMTHAKQLLANLRGVLNQNPGAAGPVLRKLTGPILIRQEPIPATKDRQRWIASFTPEYAQLLAQLSPLGCAEFVNARTDYRTEPLDVIIDVVPRYERMAPEVKRLRDKGSSINQIAASLGLVWEQVRVSLHFAETGERPQNKPKRKRTGAGAPSQRYIELSAEVVKLRETKLSFAKIAEQLGAGLGTVKRAYDHAKKDDIVHVVESGDQMVRGQYAHLSPETRNAIFQLAAEGKPVKEIATGAGCSVRSVARYLKQRETSQLADDAATTP